MLLFSMFLTGLATGIVLVLLDFHLRQRRRTDRKVQHLKAALQGQAHMVVLGKMLAGMVHELKTPLHFINNFADISCELVDELKTIAAGIAADTLPANVRTAIQQNLDDLALNSEKIRENGHHLKVTINNILMQSRPPHTLRQATPINALVQDYVMLAFHGMRARYPGFNVAINTHFDDSIEAIPVIPQSLGRVIINLLDNSFYAMQEKARMAESSYSPCLTIKTKKSNDHIEISVHDNGIGIAKDKQQTVFDEFYSSKASAQGTGLGLSICKDIIDKEHHGNIQLNSVAGEFTEFVISIPNH